jgi:hypothetical protein
MPQKLVGGLIQAAAPMTDPSTPIDTIRKAGVFQFFRDRRPETYGSMAEQLP